MSETRDAEVLPAVVQSGEVPGTLDRGQDFSGYQGVATVALNPDQVEKLKKPMPLEALDILPTGEVYASQVHYRRLLNEVFGPGSWALVPRGPFTMQGNTICREYALVGPGGRFISEAIGEAEYQPNNPRMSYASAGEAAKSNALTRCCKDLGIASECWDKRFCEEFRAQSCVRVFRKDARSKPQWRRKDAEPFWDEGGEAKPRANGGSTSQPAAGREPGSDDEQSTPGETAGAFVCPKCKSEDVVADGPKYMRCKGCNQGWRRPDAAA